VPAGSVVPRGSRGTDPLSNLSNWSIMSNLSNLSYVSNLSNRDEGGGRKKDMTAGWFVKHLAVGSGQ